MTAPAPAAVPARKSLAKAVLIGAVRGYRLLFSAWLGAGCRYEPTCSAYALVALERHGALAGAGLSAWRILRCHPGCAGGLDPVPHARPALFRHLFPSATAALPPAAADAPHR